MKWSKVIFSGLGGSVIGTVIGAVLTATLSHGISEESIIKVWANESELIDENMTLNEVKNTFEEEIKSRDKKISELNALIKEKDSEITKAKSEIDSFNSEYDLIRLENAKEYADNNNYEMAIKQLYEITSTNPEAETLLDEYTNQFVINCMSTVDDYIACDDYDSALNYINNSLNLIPNNKVLLQLLNETEAKKPIKLSDIGISDYNNFSDYIDSYVYDTTGKKHSGENVYTINAGNNASGYIRVYLGKEYSKVKGYIAVSKNTPIGRELSGNIEINLDKIQRECYDVPDRSISPIEFEVDVTDTDWFEIKYNGSYFSLSYGYESFEIVISDVYLYK